ncbi:MAG TPA: RidA family protein [Thauera sp.]|uniref:RidA family protein n=1 Tax=Thauera sp. TaxID=1905334 RepID=UPI002C0A79A3|nr:RidA family protein [Thauera sp.]HRP23599.1 RidA family protein [Thauera sp.]HRP67238.1 RidA family protein [Thauera sp.]
MEHQAINPPELFVGKAFSQTYSIRGADRLIFLSGQVDCDREGKVRNPDDLEAQLKGTLDNIEIGLRAQGASMRDLVKVNIYVVDLRPEQLARIREIRSAYFDAERPPAVTLLGVDRLAFEGLKVEIEVIAAQ